jgi:ATP-binding cassette subfamily F protein uup
VSHDRDLIDRVATATVWLSGGGQATVYAGGWSDALAQGAVIGANDPAPAPAPVAPKAVPLSARAEPARAAPGLSFTEKHRLGALPEVMAKLEAEIARLSALLAEADLYARDPARFRKASETLAERQSKLVAAEEEWLALAERAEG